MKTKTVSVIIPVYCEEKTIAPLINTLLKSPLVYEIICVNDGSDDNSLTILQSFGKKIKTIHLPHNHGKGFAMATGVDHARGDLVLFFDADLINLSTTHVKKMVALVQKHNVKAVYGYITGKPPNPFSALFKHITGQRIYYRKDLLPHLKVMKKTRHGVEIYLNHAFQNEKIAIIPLLNINHVWKHEKYGYKKGVQVIIQQFVELMQIYNNRKDLLISKSKKLDTIKEKMTKILQTV